MDDLISWPHVLQVGEGVKRKTGAAVARVRSRIEFCLRDRQRARNVHKQEYCSKWPVYSVRFNERPNGWSGWNSAAKLRGQLHSEQSTTL